MAMVMIMAPMNSSYAKEDADKEKRRTSINFEDELIEGEVKKPELFYLLQKKQFNFKRLIKLRENFYPKCEERQKTCREVGVAIETTSSNSHI